MSLNTQKSILRTTGISLVTMLVLSITQAFLQVTQVLDLSHTALLFYGLFPLFAVLCGVSCRLLAGSVWAALISSAAAFSAVILVLYDSSALINAPLYVLLSVLAFLVVHRTKKAGA